MNLLEKADFMATFGDSMQLVATDGDCPIPFWSYYDSIPAEDFQGHSRNSETVEGAWNNDSGTFQHVLVNTEDKNVFMVIVLDMCQSVVHGHHLLNLNREYGLESA
jgi:hypothetical protein